MLNKSKKKPVQLDETYTTFNDNENGTVIKRLKNSNRPRERVVVRSNEKFSPESHNSLKADKKENSSDQIKLTGQRTEGSITGLTGSHTTTSDAGLNTETTTESLIRKPSEENESVPDKQTVRKKKTPLKRKSEASKPRDDHVDNLKVGNGGIGGM